MYRSVIFEVLTDSESNLGQDEEELDPEGGTQDAVLAEVDSESLVFSAGEDGRDDIANTADFVSDDHDVANQIDIHEDNKTGIVGSLELCILQTSEDDQSNSTNDGEDG